MRSLDGAKFGSTENIRAKQWPASSRFSFATSTIQDLKKWSKNPNAVKSTELGLSLWKKCCLEKGIADEIEKYKPAELNTLLERIYAEIKNKQGEDYEPESLSARPCLSLNLAKDDSVSAKVIRIHTEQFLKLCHRIFLQFRNICHEFAIKSLKSSKGS